jgi:hypothetical protein
LFLNEHGNTLGNQPAERYKLVDKKTGKPLKSGETTHGESRYGPGKQKRYTEFATVLVLFLIPLLIARPATLPITPPPDYFL